MNLPEILEQAPSQNPSMSELVPVSPTDLAEPLYPLHVPIESNPAVVYLSSLNANSRRAMRNALDTIARLLTSGHADSLLLDWSRLRFQHTAAVRAALAEKYRPATVNKMLSALRGVLKTAWRLGQMSAEEYQRVTDVASVPGETLPAGRSLSMGELVALMQACSRDDSPMGVRDSALIALLYGAGLRRAELVALTLEDYNAHEGTLKVQGKRNKQRLVPIAGGAAEALADWLKIRGAETGGIFLPIRKGGRIGWGCLTTQAVYNILLRRAEQANVAHFTPHDCRRTFVGDLLDRGADIVTVQKLAGHANVSTTARYDRRGEAVKRKAVELLHVPYQRTGEGK